MIQYEQKPVTVFESALFKTTSTVLYTDDLVLVVDPNWLPGEIEMIRQYVAAVRKNRPLYLLFTHSDYDHIIGYGAFPEATVIASAAFADSPDQDAQIEQILQFDDDYYVDRPYPIGYPQVDIRVEKDGQTLRVGGTTLHFYLAPGHNRDGIFTIVEPLGVWIAGDYLCEVEFPYIYFSSLAYEETLSKTEGILAQFDISLLIPGHGEVATDAVSIRQRKQVALAYIHALREAIRQGKDFDTGPLWEQYRYPRLMRKYHEDNIKLIQKEIIGANR